MDIESDEKKLKNSIFFKLDIFIKVKSPNIQNFKLGNKIFISQRILLQDGLIASYGRDLSKNGIRNIFGALVLFEYGKPIANKMVKSEKNNFKIHFKIEF